MSDKIIIKIDPDLKELMPAYLQHMREYLVALPLQLREENFDELWKIGHNIRGSGGGYGLDFLTALGERLETAAKAREKPAIEAQITGIKDFLDHLVIEYADPG
ncbi:MAG TPA: Hpt domain-containing protein [Elusimicrobiales bacterium]|nr:Hpt domain-containing protein [Elusimicrobiales bacterium]